MFDLLFWRHAYSTLCRDEFKLGDTRVDLPHPFQDKLPIHQMILGIYFRCVSPTTVTTHNLFDESILNLLAIIFQKDSFGGIGKRLYQRKAVALKVVDGAKVRAVLFPLRF